MLQNRLSFDIMEVDILDLNVALHGHQRAVRLLPGLTLAGEPVGHFLTLLVDGDHDDLALVHLRLGIHDGEDTLCAGDGGQQGNHLVGDLVDGHSHLLGVVQVYAQRTDGEGDAAHFHAADDEQAAHHCGDGVADAHDLVQNRHDDHADIGGIHGTVTVSHVSLGELFLDMLFVVEGLDNLDALHHFLYIGVDQAQILLLLAVELLGLLTDLLDDGVVHTEDSHGDDEQDPVQIDHHGHGAHEGQNGGDEHGNGVFHGHLHVVGVIGETAHDLAVAVLIVVGDGHLLELIKQVLAEPVDGSLAQEAHEQALCIGGNGAAQIDGQQDQELLCKAQPALAVPGLTDIGDDVIVHDGLEEIAGSQVGNGGDQHGEQHEHKQQLVADHVVQQSQQGALGVLGLPEVLTSAGASLTTHGAGIVTVLVVLVVLRLLLALGIHSGSCLFLLSHPGHLLPAGMRRFPDIPCCGPSVRRGCPCR